MTTEILDLMKDRKNHKGKPTYMDILHLKNLASDDVKSQEQSV